MEPVSTVSSTTQKPAPRRRAATGRTVLSEAADGVDPRPSDELVTPDGRLGDGRREQLLRGAITTIVKRGFAETRVADVARAVSVSPALVIYYFGTKDNLLTEAVRYAEDQWYAEGARRMASLGGAAACLEEIVAMNCLPESGEKFDSSWAIWLDLWAQASRHPEVRRLREEFDDRWRETIRSIVRSGQQAGEFAPIDVEEFAIAFSALLDGLAIQIALEDPLVDAWRAFQIAMTIAANRLGFSFSPSARRRRPTATRGRPRNNAARRDDRRRAD
jgi:AcrR family transcriptional regulator